MVYWRPLCITYLNHPNFYILFFLLGWVMTMPIKLCFACQCQYCLTNWHQVLIEQKYWSVQKTSDVFSSISTLKLAEVISWWVQGYAGGNYTQLLFCKPWRFVPIPPEQRGVPLKTEKLAQTSVLNIKLWKYTHTKG